MKIDPTQLQPIEGTAVFYPCCGQDLETPIRLFASAAGAFYFVDVRRPNRLRGLGAVLLPIRQNRSMDHDRFRDRVSDNEFDLFRWGRRGEDAIAEIPRLGVFFHRGDTLANGEGSSGAPWLGREWLTKILAKLVPGRFLVTDGTNCPTDGPPELSSFHGHRTIGYRAVSEAKAFEFGERFLSCVGYAGDRNGPTLIWQVA